MGEGGEDSPSLPLPLGGGGKREWEKRGGERKCKEAKVK